MLQRPGQMRSTGGSCGSEVAAGVAMRASIAGARGPAHMGRQRREPALVDVDRVPYDEFSMFQENAEEFGIPYLGPPTVRREFVDVGDGRRPRRERGTAVKAA